MSAALVVINFCKTIALAKNLSSLSKIYKALP